MQTCGFPWSPARGRQQVFVAVPTPRGSRCTFFFILKRFPYPRGGLRQPAAGSRWGGGKSGERTRQGGASPSCPPRPRRLGKGSILRRGAPSIRPRDANEGERVPTARTLCRAAHLLLGERPLCPRQFTGNLACANGPAPLCGPRRHWPPSVGTAAAPGPQAPARRPRLYKGWAAPPGRAWPPAPRSPLASPRRHGPQHRGCGAAQPQREKPSKCAAGWRAAPSAPRARPPDAPSSRSCGSPWWRRCAATASTAASSS